MLICLVNDSLDRKLIELGQFNCQFEQFNPTQVFDFIKRMFASQVAMYGSSLSFHVALAPIS